MLAAAPAEAGHRRNSGAWIGGMFGAAILGTMLGSLATRPVEPRYVYVEPPPPYPPVPLYPPPTYPGPVYVAPSPYVAAPLPQASAAQRLQELQEACQRGLMSPQECEAKRQAIISGM